MNAKVIIFGTGLFYSRRKNTLPKQTNIVAFIDNNIEMKGKCIDGIPVYGPKAVLELKYDIIILASITPVEMRDELLALGIPKEKIMFWEQYVGSKSHGILKKYEVSKKRKEKKILLIVPTINYAGGFLTALYAALAFKERGYYVVIAAPTANHDTISEVNNYGVDVWLCPALPYITKTELKWINNFDFVLANSLQNMLCVNRINKRKTVLWWLHEHSRQYKNIVEQYNSELDVSLFKDSNIFAVSNLARNNFLNFFPEQKVNTFTFGLPDFYSDVYLPHEKIIIAIIGNISELKNQKGLIYALKTLSQQEINKIECWIIGRDGGKKYKKEIDEITKTIEQVKVFGELNRSEIEKVYQQIDIVVCTSLEETMSIAIVEGMMNCKICITNTNTGIAEYIQDDVNGYIYEAEKIDSLVSKLKYVIKNFDALDSIRKKARKTYEEYFSMNVFSNKLESILQKSCNGEDT